jgi:hypothetical protein
MGDGMAQILTVSFRHQVVFSHGLSQWEKARGSGAADETVGRLAADALLSFKPGTDDSPTDLPTLALDALRYVAAGERGELWSPGLSPEEANRVIAFAGDFLRSGRNPFSVSYHPGTNADVADEAAELALDAYTIASLAMRAGYNKRRGDDDWRRLAEVHTEAARIHAAAAEVLDTPRPLQAVYALPPPRQATAAAEVIEVTPDALEAPPAQRLRNWLGVLSRAAVLLLISNPVVGPVLLATK